MSAFHWKNPVLWVLLLFAAAGLAEAQPPVLRAPQPRPGDVPPPLEYPPFPLYGLVSVHRIVDGDTVYGRLHLPWGVDLRPQRIRAGTFDAWEPGSRRGDEATEALTELLDGGDLWMQQLPDEDWATDDEVGRGKYGRPLGRWIVVKDGRKISVKHWMAARGHLKPERGNSQD